MDYEVQQGDCLNSIAKVHGLLWTVIWNHPRNASLKAKRKDPNILYPGDVLFIPEKNLRIESGETQQSHTFVLKDSSCKLKITLLCNDKPRASEPYRLTIDGVVSQGQTNSSGSLEQTIEPDASVGHLSLTNVNEDYDLLLGHMDPITEISGIQMRLQNLGFYIGERADGIMGPKTAGGVRAFQSKYGLKVDGIPGPKTQAKLKELYSC